MAKKRKPPENYLRCRGCKAETDWDGDCISKECPDCGDTMTIRCGARPKPSSGRHHRCRWTCKPHQRCHMHNGKALKGTEAPAFVHGEKSRYLPARYLDEYQRALGDPDAQRGMSDQLALMAALENEALKRLGTGESGEVWDEVGKVCQQLAGLVEQIRDAQEHSDRKRERKLARRVYRTLEAKLFPLVLDGTEEESARREVVDLMVKRSRLIRVQQQGEKTVPIETLAVLQVRFVALMTKYIQDSWAMQSLLAELREESLPGWHRAETAATKMITSKRTGEAKGETTAGTDGAN